MSLAASVLAEVELPLYEESLHAQSTNHHPRGTARFMGFGGSPGRVLPFDSA